MPKIDLTTMAEEAYKRLGELYSPMSEVGSKSLRYASRRLDGRKLDDIAAKIAANPILGEAWEIPESDLKSYQRLLHKMRKMNKEESFED